MRSVVRGRAIRLRARRATQRLLGRSIYFPKALPLFAASLQRSSRSAGESALPWRNHITACYKIDMLVQALSRRLLALNGSELIEKENNRSRSDRLRADTREERVAARGEG